jgi:hypothetical protein
MTEEISQTIKKGTLAYYTHKTLMTSNIFSKQTKNKLCTTPDQTNSNFGCKNSTLPVRDVNRLLVFGRQILKRAYGTFQSKEG